MTVYVTYWQLYDDVEICDVYQHEADAKHAIIEWRSETGNWDGDMQYEAVDFHKGSADDEQTTKDASKNS